MDYPHNLSGGWPQPSDRRRPSNSDLDHHQLADVRERTRALEVSHQHLERYVTDRIRAHHDRLALGDDKMGRMADRLTAVERTAQDASVRAASNLAALTVMQQQMTERRVIEEQRQQQRSDRRAARREALVLMSYGVALLTALGALSGLVTPERAAAVREALGLVAAQ